MGFFYLFVPLRFQSVGLGADIPHLSALKGGGSFPESLHPPSEQEVRGKLAGEKTGKIQKRVFSDQAKEPSFFIWFYFILEVVPMSMFSKYSTRVIPIFFLSLLMIFSGETGLSKAFAQEGEEVDPPEITNGERLFLETRFAQFFKVFLDGGGDVNDPLPAGDPAVDKAVNSNLPPDQFADSPFAGQSINCRSCHFVDEIGVEEPLPAYGMRTYTDFARRSPVPAREDGHSTTVRNSPPLVNASLPRKRFFLHFDAEFHTMVDLVKGTLTGRNYGWLSDEIAQAVAHTAKVIRV